MGINEFEYVYFFYLFNFSIMDAMQNKYSDMVNQIEEIETAVSTK